MVRWTRLGAAVNKEDGWTDHGDGIEREGDNPTYHGFFAESIEWLPAFRVGSLYAIVRLLDLGLRASRGLLVQEPVQ